MPLSFVKESILELIKQQHPEIDENGYISVQELKKFKVLFAEQILKLDNPILSKSEQEILYSIGSNDVLSRPPEEDDSAITFGQRMADKIARFGGSWKFIISFGVVCMIWMSINILSLKAFDPYPFILLNLVLSCVAALQAPLIMMSQNRKEEKDRRRSENDYKINLKAELEIQQLHEKIDILLIKMSEQGMK